MHRIKLSVAILLGVVGTVWIGQGMGILPGSFMTGDRFWAIAGIVAVGAGVYVAWDTLRRR
jgi:uncharacterized membrane protein